MRPETRHDLLNEHSGCIFVRAIIHDACQGQRIRLPAIAAWVPEIQIYAIRDDRMRRLRPESRGAIADGNERDLCIAGE